MAALRTGGIEPDGWADLLPEVQRVINNSESKTTTKTPFEMLHGYRPRFHQGVLRELSTTTEDWVPPEDLRTQTRTVLEDSKKRMKTAYDARRHDNIHYQVGEVVVMKRAPNSTGVSTKLQDRYRGPLVVTEVLPGDVYRVCELYNDRPSRFATTAHVAQLKSWRLMDAEGEEVPGTLTQDCGNGAVNIPGKPCEGAPRVIPTIIPKEGRPQRKPRPPAWMNDYETC